MISRAASWGSAVWIQMAEKAAEISSWRRLARVGVGVSVDGGMAVVVSLGMKRTGQPATEDAKPSHAVAARS
jgi:hypothetical protein